VLFRSKILLDRNIPFDVNATRRATVEALIKTVDSGASLLDVEQYHKMLMEKSLESAEEWPEEICYLKLRGVYRDAGEEVVGCLAKWNAAGKMGVILDLRSAGGESLASVDKIAELYVSGDPLLYQLKSGCGTVVESHRLKVDSMPMEGDMRLVVVVNEMTRDASEVLAALLKSRRHVLLIGARTKGDAGARESVRLSQNEILHIATRRVVINGQQYETSGVVPDITVDAGKGNGGKLPAKEISIKPESGKAQEDRRLMEKVYSDPALLRATDILLGLKATVAYGRETTTNTPGLAGEH